MLFSSLETIVGTLILKGRMSQLYQGTTDTEPFTWISEIQKIQKSGYLKEIAPYVCAGVAVVQYRYCIHVLVLYEF